MYDSLNDRFDLESLIRALVQDLNELRAGKINIRDAHARAVLAKEILRGVHYAVVAQRYFEERALPAPGTE